MLPATGDVPNVPSQTNPAGPLTTTFRHHHSVAIYPTDLVEILCLSIVQKKGKTQIENIMATSRGFQLRLPKPKASYRVQNLRAGARVIVKQPANPRMRRPF